MILPLLNNPFQTSIHFENKLKWVAILTFVNLLINIPFVFLLEFGEANEVEDYLNRLNLAEQFLLIALLPSILEEYLFRYPLNLKTHSINIIFILTIPFSVLSVTNFSQNSLYVCALFIFFYLAFKKFISHTISKKNKVYVFYGMSLLFAVVHTGNFSGDPILTSTVLIVLTFISAILFGLIRIHIGFKYAVLSHFFYNVTIVGLSYVVP